VSACAYCGVRRAVNQDHVVPKSLRKNYMANVRVSQTRREWMSCIPEDLLGLVGTCFECNHLKAARRLVPPSWADKVDALNEFFGGTPWRVWHGDVKELAFTKVHL
jgi:5-methylcytosine-specific restriction endonuclease McrA